MQEDWRLLRGQDEYLKNERLKYCLYAPKDRANDHDHCEFCMEKFIVSHPTYAYCTLDCAVWICKDCFKDFQNQFNWELIEI